MMRPARAGRAARATRTRNGAPSNARGQAAALVLLFIVTSAAFILLDRGRLLDPLKGAAERPVGAASGAFTDVGGRIDRFGDRFGDAGALRAENDRLRAENDRLRAAEARVSELERENKQLTAQANFAQENPQYPLLPARVIGRDPASREKYLLVNRGSEDGVRYGMPVVSPTFLVGIVTEVTPQRAKVKLIIDEKMFLGVQLQQEPRTPGILYGNWQQGLKGGAMVVRHVDRNAAIPTNAPVVTSGLTTCVPEGYLVGATANVRRNEQSDAQEFDVIPIVKFDELESVTIVITDCR